MAMAAAVGCQAVQLRCNASRRPVGCPQRFGRALASPFCAASATNAGRPQARLVPCARRTVGKESRLRAVTGERPAAGSAVAPSNAAARGTERAQRLQVLIQLRKLYRNLLRAEGLLEQPSPVYSAKPPTTTAAGGKAGAAAAAQDEQQQEQERQQGIDEAVELVAEMELTAEQLKAGMRALRSIGVPFGGVLRSASEGEAAVEAAVARDYSALVDRVAAEVPLLPFPSVGAAQAAIDARNVRLRSLVSYFPGSESGDEGPAPAGGPEQQQRGRGLGERLGKAEKAAGQFVAQRLQPAVQRVKEEGPGGVVQGLRSSAVWAGGVWERLNGATGAGGSGDAPGGLPLGTPTEEVRRKRVERLNLELDALEKKLQDSSKARESRLRKAGIQGRARMAAELRDMDNEISALSKALAVRTLELEMEYIYGALEEEALDIVGGSKGDKKVALNRRGSSDEVALLAAEFMLLDDALSAMIAAVESGEALFLDDAELAKLATEIPDLRLRLGVGDTQVFGGTGFSLVKLQLQINDGVVKIVEGVLFGVRGVKLLFNDMGAAGKLFWRAVSGGTLKPREVSALRRTVKDVLTFVPFAIILIVPLTPVGHVLIFGFIQRYFPGFFPSQFTNRRQELMSKYDELKQQLKQVQLAAEAEGDELAFKEAAMAAMMQLQPGGSGGEGGSQAAGASAAAQQRGGSRGGKGGREEEEGPAAKAVRRIEAQLEAAATDSYTGGVETPEEGAAH